MSQVQRHDAGQDGDQPAPSSSLLNKPASSASRDSPSPSSSSSSPLSNTLIPRDFLGQRSDVQGLRSAAAGRKPNPSPLASSHLPQSPPTVGREVSDMPAKTESLSPPRDVQNQKLQRTGSTSTGSIDAGNVSLPGGPVIDPVMYNGNKGLQSGKQTPPDITHSFPTPKPAMGPPPRPQPAASPPDSPKSTTSSAMTDRPIHRHKQMPRTSSIDSAISSISSTASHSHKSSFDAASVNPAEIANLINAAGTPEAVILHLLKEKQHAASQNAQLWKLVDKQRALVLGLNKDLERAMKDKDRYKKKLKEMQSQAPAVPSMTPRSPFENLRDDSESSALSDNVDSKTKIASNRGHQKDLQQDKQVTPKKPQDPQPTSSPMDPTLVPSPLHLLQQAQEAVTPAHARQDACPSKESATESLPAPPKFSISPPNAASRHAIHNAPSNARFNDHPSSPTLPRSNDIVMPHEDSRTPRPPPALQSALEPPSLSIIEPSPLTEKPPEKNIPPARKAPPAPLNLNQANKPSPHLHQASPEDNSESEYDDILEVDEIPAFERGRRKTREEDDKVREAIMIKEQESRSKSKKKKLSKGGSKPPDATKETQPPEVPVDLPSSPRQMVPQSPPAALAGRLSPPDSLAAILSPGSSDATSISQRLVASPPMSPGLPVSPRPVDRPMGSPLPRMPRDGAPAVASPPLSPRMGMMPGLPLSPRAPKHPIPLPPNTPLSIASPPANKVNAPPLSPKAEAPQSSLPSAAPVVPEVQTTSPTSPAHPPKSHQIYKGLADEDYPDLLLPPNALPSIEVKVASSRLRPKRSSYIAPKPYEEEPVFTLSVFSRAHRSELWRVEKVIMALPQLDQQIKAASDFSAKLPDRKLFSGHSPAVIDARRNALNVYFETLLDTPMDEKAALVVCHFLSTDAIEPRDDETSLLSTSSKSKPVLALGPDGRPRKEGYLTKRGKNFGGWKVRFFVLQGPELKYYESPGGPHLGNIKLVNAQIGKQAQSNSPSRGEDDIENQYRHAFLILEPKRRDSTSLIRHVLCAESDQERDGWVEALLQYVDYESEEEHPRPVSKRAESGKSHITGFEAKIRQYSSVNLEGIAKEADSPGSDQPDTLKGFSYEDAVPAKPPTRVGPTDRNKDETPSPTTATSSNSPSSTLQLPSQDHSLPSSQSSKSISGPTNGVRIEDAGLWGNKPAPSPASASKDKDHKKRSIWGFRQRSSSDLILQSQSQSHNDSITNSAQHGQHLQQPPSPHYQQIPSNERHHAARAVFGLPLAEAVELCPPQGVDVYLPAVVYRCIEYLRARNAAGEEGIFRLSGSNVVVRSLKERFNTEGDLDFLADDHYYDVHAVASLFKSYLRELPSTILTRELHLDFLHVLELGDKKEKIAAFNVLVHRLPKANLCLLEALSQYLIEIVSNSDKNKMTVRNVGIVFSPTLNIPAPVFSMFLTDFDEIFRKEPAEPQIKTVEISVDKPMTPEDIRSPRHQMFSDIPTPAYNQTSFSSVIGPKAEDRPVKPVVEETGFIPMQPSYEQRAYGQLDRPQQSANPNVQPQYGSMNRMLAPSNASSVKAKRRESSMLFMGVGHRKSSMPSTHEEHFLVTDETAFE